MSLNRARREALWNFLVFDMSQPVPLDDRLGVTWETPYYIWDYVHEVKEEKDGTSSKFQFNI